MLAHGKTTSSSSSRGGGGLCFEMWLVVLVGFLAIVTSVHFYFERKRKYRDIEKLPRPPTKFLFGNALEFGGDTVGQKYAMVNSKTTVANMVRHFELHPVVPEHKPLLASDAVLKSANGLPIKLKLRE